MRKGFAGNIYRLYIIKMAKWFSLIMPIIVVFFKDNGLSMTEIFWLKSVYSIGMLVLEIPSGYFGDFWGRRKTLIVGSILTSVGFSVYALSGQFWQFLLAELVLGMGQSFVSGADSAMLFDSLKSMKRDKEYLKFEGKVTSIGNFSEAIAGVLGGLLAAISLRLPFMVQAVFSIAAIPAAITLVEPNYCMKHRVAGMKDVMKVVRYALIENKVLRNFILLSAIIGTATLTYAWFIQPYLVETGLPISMFGIVWTALNLTVGVSSIYAHKVESYLGRNVTIVLILVFVIFAYFLSGSIVSMWGLPIFFIFYLVRGVATPVLKDHIHVLIDSEVRATVLSLRNMFIRLNFAIVGPVLGWLTDQYSLKVGLYVAGATFFTLGVIVVVNILFMKRA